MKNLIFSDIDGVLNSTESLKRNNGNRLFYGRIAEFDIDYMISWHMSYLDFEKVMLLKRLVNRTDSEVVMLSAWKSLPEWSLIEECFDRMGIPIAGCIDDSYGRGAGIMGYLFDHEVGNYVVLDDEVFGDYEWFPEIMDHLFKCDNYNEGLTDEIVEEAESFLNDCAKEKSLRFEKLKL